MVSPSYAHVMLILIVWCSYSTTCHVCLSLLPNKYHTKNSILLKLMLESNTKQSTYEK